MLCKNIGKVIFVSAALLSPVATMAAPAFYVQGQGGLSSWNMGENSSRIDFKGNNYTWRVSGGSLWDTCTPWQYGVEAGIANYPRLARLTGEYSYLNGEEITGSLSVKGYSVDILSVAKYNFSRQLNAFGKVGFAYLNQKITASGQQTLDGGGIVDSTITRNGHTVAPEVALGVGYKFTPNLEANLGVNAIFAGSSDFSNVMTTTAGLTAGLSYYFS